MWVYFREPVLVEVSVVCFVLLLRDFFSARLHFLYKWNQGKLVLTWNSERSSPESAASNERLLEVSNKRITSFVGFQKISGYLSAHSAPPSEPRPFTDGVGAGPRGGPPSCTSSLLRDDPSVGGADISAVREKQTSVSFIWNILL